MAVTRSRWILNSSMNLLGGASAALVTFCIPPILARFLPELDYALWNLILPIVAYLALFGSGIHLATAKFISHEDKSHSTEDRERTVRAAFAIASVGVLIALLAVGALTVFYPKVYPGIRPEMLPNFRSCLLWIGCSASLQLFALVPLGVFTGHQQNGSYVSAQVVVRACTLGAVWWQASHHQSLTILAVTYAITGFLLVPGTWLVLARSHSHYVRGLFHLPDFTRFRQLLGYCGTFSLWTLAEILVSSLDTVLIGRVEMLAVNPYALSLSLITVFSGLLHALVSPLLPGVSSLSSTAEGMAKLPAILNRATFWVSIFAQVVLIGFLFLGHPFLEIYAAKYAKAAFPFVTILLISSIFRQITVPYGFFLLSTSLHGKAGGALLIEGIVNLAASLFLGSRFGAIGVAYGTLVGAIVGKVLLGIQAFPKTRHLVPSTSSFLFHAFGKPLLYLSPAYALLALWLLKFNTFASK